MQSATLFNDLLIRDGESRGTDSIVPPNRFLRRQLTRGCAPPSKIWRFQSINQDPLLIKPHAAWNLIANLVRTPETDEASDHDLFLKAHLMTAFLFNQVFLLTTAVQAAVMQPAVLHLAVLPQAGASNPSAEQSESKQNSVAETLKIKQALLKTLESNPRPTANDQASINVWSRRADALFFLERFPQAVKEYEQMISIDPSIKKSHWRLGIAYFFNDQPKKAVQIFEGYHSFDDVDRENGIWRYLSQFKATNSKTAEQELFKYEKDDREPFPAVYKLFDGSMTAQQVIESIPANLPKSETEQQAFYIRLYCGMLSVVRKQNSDAIGHLEKAVLCQWPQTAGYGPNYMWHVARIQLNQLKIQAK